MPENLPSAKRPGGAARRRAVYLAVLEGLRVESNPRYRRGRQGHDETYCNLFVADVTRALGAPIPIVLQSPDGTARFLNANTMQAWLLAEGSRLGWRRVSVAAAQQAANAGHPVVAAWSSSEPARSGHIAMVRPGPLPVSPETGPRIAQAGQTNYRSIEAAVGFGGAVRLADVLYFVYQP